MDTFTTLLLSILMGMVISFLIIFIGFYSLLLLLFIVITYTFNSYYFLIVLLLGNSYLHINHIFDITIYFIYLTVIYLLLRLLQKSGFPQEKVNEINGSWFDPSNPINNGHSHSNKWEWLFEIEQV